MTGRSHPPCGAVLLALVVAASQANPQRAGAEPQASATAAGPRSRARPCVCDPAAPASYSRATLLAFAAEVDATSAAEGEGDAKTFRKIAHLFQKADEELRRGVLATLASNPRRADAFKARAGRLVAKLGRIVERAQAAGLLHGPAGSQLPGLFGRFRADVTTITVPCVPSCRTLCGSCCERTMECLGGGVPGSGCGCLIVEPDFLSPEQPAR